MQVEEGVIGRERRTLLGGNEMTLDRVQERIINYKKALDKLQRIIDEPEVNDYRLDALIQRFEFTYELAW